MASGRRRTMARSSKPPSELTGTPEPLSLFCHFGGADTLAVELLVVMHGDPSSCVSRY